MQFSKSIPEEVLGYPNTSAFVKVLDELQAYKQDIISGCIRSGNPALCTNKKWLISYIGDFGFSGIPEFLPLVCIQQFALNMDVVFRLIGTLRGLKLLCESLALGTSTFDTSHFSPPFDFLFPNSDYDGFVTDTNVQETFRYLVDNNDFNKARSLSATVRSKVFSGMSNENKAVFVDFLKGAIDKYLGFHPNCTITVTTGTLPNYVYPQDFNDYFKNV